MVHWSVPCLPCGPLECAHAVCTTSLLRNSATGLHEAIFWLEWLAIFWLEWLLLSSCVLCGGDYLNDTAVLVHVSFKHVL